MIRRRNIFKRSKLKFHSQGHTDFLESNWLTLTIDAALETPVNATLWYGGLPLQLRTCRFGH